ncbi:hypothetical protein BDP81DRAFT_400588 [Colletotrichum phormii]|uniref:Uncharacterized protein n=1 Tax=Colletotrichum phormii TaxID=359342 RepID=A0AAI9ZD93_9PEZI|nr:uncharacterized protein BDP81DRAFT_400588 [Colletotrichum phormii]KAK1622093.1 hypothetical protein BDP81DRAFT_400588 [Colletotrichum phormii]
MKSNLTVEKKKKKKEKEEKEEKQGLQVTGAKTDGSKVAYPSGKVAGSPIVQQQQQRRQPHEKPRRVIKLRPQHASPLETADDDEYDDCWDPYYEEPPTKDDKVVEEDFVFMKKPGPSR